MEDHTLAAGEFKATCLKLMDEVAETGRSVVITKRGKPVAKLVPVARQKPRRKPLFGALKGSIEILGDIVAPIPSDDVKHAAVRRWDRVHHRSPRQPRA